MKVVIIGHGSFADGLKSAAEAILGPTVGTMAVPLLPGEGLDAYGSRLDAAIDTLRGQTVEDVMVLADLLGGTPSNAALAAAKRRPNLYVLTGANLPMLLEILQGIERGAAAEGLLADAMASGRGGIVDAVRLLKEEVGHE
jgi:mannose/fructose/sorbose-specific phosphotransferase system IIA component